MAKLISEIDNHKNSFGRKRGFFGGDSIASVGRIGSTLSQMKDVLPIILVGGIILLAMIMS